MQKLPIISVIIVSYNVRDFLQHALQSIQRALKDIPAEIFVVDNASMDGSPQLIRKNFPQLNLIENTKNLGFSAANNIALKKSSGKYVVLINPDTVVQEDTFTALLSFMENNPDAGAATCKILNPDGSFSVDSRHSIPTPMTAFWKQVGFNKLFPKSKIFGRYNLTYLDENKSYPVDAISGSFMFIRQDVFAKVGLLDEDFFMYCEDIDFCHRINKSGWKIYYFPNTSIIHYKGESTRRNNLDYVINFNKSLYIFYKKHFQRKYDIPIRWMILLGVFIRAIFVYITRVLNEYFDLILDLVILNAIIFLTFVIRFELKSGFYYYDYLNQYIVINALASLVFLGVAFFLDLYGKFKYSLVQIFKTNFMTFFIVSALTFFFNQFAFSRLVVIISALFSILFMILWRFILRLYWKKGATKVGKDIFQKKTLLVGTERSTVILINKLRQNIQTGYTLNGLISITSEEVGKTISGLRVVTNLERLKDYVELEKIDQVIFSTHNIAYEKIIKTMSQLDNTRIEFKMVPENLEVIIGKSIVERLMDYPLVEINYPIGKTFNRYTKRLFDLVISSIFLIFTLPIWVYQLWFGKKRTRKYEIWGDKGQKIIIKQNRKQPLVGSINKILFMVYIFKGQLSLVGAPIRQFSQAQPTYFSKPGLMGLAQVNKENISHKEDQEMYELIYIKNQSFWLDMEIIIKSFLQIQH
jgi:GT2 family glycosyltransferase/lipopolysaccharide/colanic/teichoic acid biosynthesis glycosyltransferase